jgi:hypothetical protein
MKIHGKVVGYQGTLEHLEKQVIEGIKDYMTVWEVTPEKLDKNYKSKFCKPSDLLSGDVLLVLIP